MLFISTSCAIHFHFAIIFDTLNETFDVTPPSGRSKVEYNAIVFDTCKMRRLIHA